MTRAWYSSQSTIQHQVSAGFISLISHLSSVIEKGLQTEGGHTAFATGKIDRSQQIGSAGAPCPHAPRAGGRNNRRMKPPKHGERGDCVCRGRHTGHTHPITERNHAVCVSCSLFPAKSLYEYTSLVYCAVPSSVCMSAISSLSVSLHPTILSYIYFAGTPGAGRTWHHQLAWTLDLRMDFSDGVLLLRQEPDAVWRAAVPGRQ